MSEYFEELEGTYTHTEHCRNCGAPNMLDIPKGETISQYLKRVRCSNCGVVLKESDYKMHKPIEEPWL
jgi:hypothetical protein